jgi:hypothetical protein
LANSTARKFRRQRRASRLTAYSRTTSIRYMRRQSGPIPMDAAMPDTTCSAAGRELQAFFGIATRRQRPASRLRTRRRSLHGRRRPPITPARRTTTDDASSIEARISHNVGNQRLATIGEPYRWILSRVRCIALCTPVMGVIVWGASPLCEIGSLKEIRIPSDHSDWQSTR